MQTLSQMFTRDEASGSADDMNALLVNQLNDASVQLILLQQTFAMATCSASNDSTFLFDNLPVKDKEYGTRLRRHLQFFFMDPMQKWKLRKQFPFKLTFQILKVIFVTLQVGLFIISYCCMKCLQLVLFAQMRISHVDFIGDSETVMRHKFLKDWDHSRDTITYPPQR